MGNGFLEFFLNTEKILNRQSQKVQNFMTYTIYTL